MFGLCHRMCSNTVASILRTGVASCVLFRLSPLAPGHRPVARLNSAIRATSLGCTRAEDVASPVRRAGKTFAETAPCCTALSGGCPPSGSCCELGMAHRGRAVLPSREPFMVCLSVCWLSILYRRKSPPEPVSAVSCEDERCFTAHGSPFRCMLCRAPHSRNGIRARIVARSAGGSTGKKLALIRGNLGCPSSPFAVASSSVTAFTLSVQYPPFRLVGFPSASVDAAMFLTVQVMIHILARMYC